MYLRTVDFFVWTILLSACGQIQKSPVSRSPALETVRQALINSKEGIPNTFLVATEGVEKKVDSLHYNTKGPLELGKRFSEK